MSLTWTPRRDGVIYCSSACGYGCTFAAFALARERSKRLAKRLGKGWKPRVWENMGWHYCVQHNSGCCSIYPHERYFTAYLSDSGGPGGRWFGHGNSPENAMLAAVKGAKEEIDGLRRLLLFIAERGLK